MKGPRLRTAALSNQYAQTPRHPRVIPAADKSTQIHHTGPFLPEAEGRRPIQKSTNNQAETKLGERRPKGLKELVASIQQERRVAMRPAERDVPVIFAQGAAGFIKP